MNLNTTSPMSNSLKTTITAEKMNRADQILTLINTFKVATGNSPVIVEEAELGNQLSNYMSEKSFTAASVTTGSGLIAQNNVLPLFYSDLQGGGFVSGGIDYRPNVRTSVTLPSLSINGGFVAQVCGTPSTNEISLFGRKDIALQGYTAYIDGCEDVLARNENPAELITTFETALENQKLILSDSLIAQNITTAASGAIAINPASFTPTGGVGAVHLGMIKLVETVGKYGQGQAKFFLNHAGYSRLMSEQTTQGQFLESKYFFVSNVGGALPQSGLVGYFGGHEVILVGSEPGKGILGTYTVSASGAVTAQTAGTSTVVIFAVPKAITLIRGAADMDYTQVFTGRDDRQSFFEGKTTIGARTYMGAGLANPLRVAYYAF